MPNRPHTLDADPVSHVVRDHISCGHIYSAPYSYNKNKTPAPDDQPKSQHLTPLEVPITHSYDACATPFTTDSPLRPLHHDIAPTVWLDLQPFADMSPTTVPISSSPEVHRSLEATDPVYVLAVAESTVSPLFEASVPASKLSLRSLESDLAAAEYLTEESPEYRIPPLSVVAVALPPETVVSIAGLSPDRFPVKAPVTPPPEHPPGLPFSPHYVSSPPEETFDSTIPPLPLHPPESDLAAVTSPPKELV
ncbi:hypothetical protein PENSPDRAFT_99276 [Peniophora sp. CONT]|nr:hypothetical protein PENSPDRAFT_99276 [Peniophora sp. CONT]